MGELQVQRETLNKSKRLRVMGKDTLHLPLFFTHAHACTERDRQRQRDSSKLYEKPRLLSLSPQLHVCPKQLPFIITSWTDCLCGLSVASLVMGMPQLPSQRPFVHSVFSVLPSSPHLALSTVRSRSFCTSAFVFVLVAWYSVMWVCCRSFCQSPLINSYYIKLYSTTKPCTS